MSVQLDICLVMRSDWMDKKEYKKHSLEISKMLLKYQIDNNIEDEWLLRMLLEACHSNVVRFESSD